MRSQWFTWAQDPAGNPYIGSAMMQLDPGTAYQQQTTTTQTLDAHGNVTQSQIYDFGNASTPARTYTNAYLADANYTSRGIWNRLVSTSVTDGLQTQILGGNAYDSSFVLALPLVNGQPPPLRLHDDSYGTGFQYRGNVTTQSSPSGPVSYTATSPATSRAEPAQGAHSPRLRHQPLITRRRQRSRRTTSQRR